MVAFALLFHSVVIIWHSRRLEFVGSEQQATTTLLLPNMPFGQVVLGPPGSGKSTYCYGMQQFLAVVERDMVVVNLDPGNEVFPYKCHVNVMDLVSVENVMNEFHLGPNGGTSSFSLPLECCSLTWC